MILSCQCCPRVSNIPNLTYKWPNRVIIKNAIILDSIPDIFNIRDADVVICIKLVILKIDLI